jgi:predicted RNase H-like nuclease (RuvC/YqgF family)
MRRQSLATLDQLHAATQIELDKQRSRARMGKDAAVAELEKELREKRAKSKRLEERFNAFTATAAL